MSQRNLERVKRLGVQFSAVSYHILVITSLAHELEEEGAGRAVQRHLYSEESGDLQEPRIEDHHLSSLVELDPFDHGADEL